MSDGYFQLHNAAIGVFEILKELREGGWRVAVHNDFMLKGELHTFWLLTYGNWCVKGEAKDDYTALRIVRVEVAKLVARASTERTTERSNNT